jgi:hypothetical protein
MLAVEHHLGRRDQSDEVFIPFLRRYTSRARLLIGTVSHSAFDSRVAELYRTRRLPTEVRLG